ncbi:hypothetical protein NCCP1664_29290 [Zafaria cholistanensis]|uniref:Uncharacterized protein n=1 Tax=Zafaria cholistanensis TaxID=1682741 RepID=A0A5A7NU82_9MICC|nr:hypothetical protein NCCP1664_29290 [Zafaria cholistanensis]
MGWLTRMYEAPHVPKANNAQPKLPRCACPYALPAAAGITAVRRRLTCHRIHARGLYRDSVKAHQYPAGTATGNGNTMILDVSSLQAVSG